MKLFNKKNFNQSRHRKIYFRQIISNTPIVTFHAKLAVKWLWGHKSMDCSQMPLSTGKLDEDIDHRYVARDLTLHTYINGRVMTKEGLAQGI